MDYIEKLQQKSAALRNRANAAGKNQNYQMELNHKADIVADKANKFQNWRDTNPERYAEFNKSQKIIGYGGWIFWCVWLFVLAPLAIVLVESGQIALVNKEPPQNWD